MKNKKVKIEEDWLISSWGDTLLDAGVTPIPNNLLFYRRRLGLTSSELEFILSIISLNARKFNEIRDKDISPECKNLSRYKISLERKGYLNYERKAVYRDGRFIGICIFYNLAGLKKAIERIVEEDKKIKNMQCPVEENFYAPSLFGEEVKKENINPRKLLNKKLLNDSVEENKIMPRKYNKSQEEKFIEKYQALHKKLMGYEFRYNEKAKNNYKSYLIEAFINRKNSVNKSLKIAEEYFLKMPLDKRTTLKLQDLVRMALSKKIYIENMPDICGITDSDLVNKAYSGQSPNKTNKNNSSIPNGIDNLNKLLKVIEKKGDINETYKTITNTA
ncbi:hypothetical protein EPJ70_01060 [Brachyspira aalborgi]|uniref:Uncharacterized protein n=1 Tax=Brachyspira aalborgi TaxID=29522 RepID=A0A5C8FCD1_9SPIR|nr:hypothetical protein [Brachyspira aalborgi]TXJ46761.1 hypothetical protein EPJ70_01060 [Brachyspira aalborgi]TXJ57751.1 hypothetical protein EPJ67_03630 [Brachyspira aalborgi]